MKINIFVRAWHGWKQYENGNCEVWFNGYLLNTSQRLFLDQGIELLEADKINENQVIKWLKSTRGHFSFLITSEKKIICGVDLVRSVPIFYSEHMGNIKIGNYAPDIVKSIGGDKNKYDKQAALEISMSGYTIGNKTLHPDILQLSAGEVLIHSSGKTEVIKYYSYSPWKVKIKPAARLKKELTDVSMQVLEDMIKSTNGRQLVVPLSAGYDSRFIVSGLKELGARDVFCFSYGIKNNFEVKTAEQVALCLEYPWLYVPLSISIQKKIFSESRFSDFWKFTDTLSNHPVLIDYSAIKLLKESGKISNDAVFVNGNSGDFITGGHMLHNNYLDFDKLIKVIINKHFSLWECLKTNNNIIKIKNEVEKSIRHIINKHALSLVDIPEIGESIEWDGRQSKLVTTTQRSYEFHGYEWRLPMWDPLYMNFWEGVERKHKLNQSLYIETLLDNNWGGVWDGININNYSISSYQLRLLRNFAKLFFILLGKKQWHHFDKTIFSYFYDETAATAIVPYRKALLDMCGARNRNSWIVKKYLTEKGIELNNV